MNRVRIAYRVLTPSIPGPELPLIHEKTCAERVADKTRKAGHPTEVREVLLSA